MEINNMKKSLAALCCHLNLLFDLDFTAEDFYSAKFNKNNAEVVPKFWRLLNKLTINEELVNPHRIKGFFESIKYRNSGFYSISDFLNQGNRDLLIAVSYVLSEGVQRAIKREISKRFFNQKFYMLQDDTVPPSSPDFSTQSERNFLRYFAWIENRIDLNTREICELQNHNEILLRKIKNSSRWLEEFCMNEILALNDEKYAKIFLDKTEKISKILMNHEEWSKNESAFWQWLVSVLQSSPNGQNMNKSRKISFTNNKKKSNYLLQ